MTIDEKYQAELVQSKKDHQAPTAGAMIGHILANLKIHRMKLDQAVFYAAGQESLVIRRYFPHLVIDEDKQFDRLAELMLDENEVIPTTTAEFVRYSIIKESGKFKYEPAAAMLEAAGKDFDTQLLFLTRGIKLAEKEEKFALRQFLVQLQSWMSHQIRRIRQYMGTKPEAEVDNKD
jgi:Ferritin-like domain.